MSFGVARLSEILPISKIFPSVLPAILTGALITLGLASAPALAQRVAEPVVQGIGPGAADDRDAARWSGWLQFDAAYAWPQPGHFTNLRGLGELAGRGDWGNGVKWKLSARALLDGAYAWSHHYPAAVRDDQRAEAVLHEAYVDFSHGDWEFRLGKQNIIWGELVGMFVADVVSAKDMRSFILPDFDLVRIPQWAARAEWFMDDSHLELIWLPAPAIDDIGKPGAEFFPYPMRFQGFDLLIDGDQRPTRKLSNSSVGARLSTLIDGWDLSAFVYQGPDSQAAFERSVIAGPTPTVVYEGRHKRVTRVGGTVTKDFDGIVGKLEFVHSRGREFGTVVLDSSNGLVELKSLDWAASLDMTPADDWRLNMQVFQRAFLDYDARIGLDRHENGASLLVSHAFTGRIDGEFLAISSLNRSDRLLRAMLTWKRDAHSRIRAGVDVFSGDPLGQFGRYDKSDRIWAEYRYSF